MDKNIQGILIKKTATFYYIDYGDLLTPKAGLVDRTLRTLVQRDLVDITENTNAWKVISFKEAEDTGAKIEPIYISVHAKESKAEELPKVGKRSVFKKSS